MGKVIARGAVAAAIAVAALAAPAPRAAATEAPLDEAALEAQLEAALEAYERFGVEFTACMAEVGIAVPWDEEGEEIDEAEAAYLERIDELCDAGRLDEAEALHREMMRTLHGLTPAQYEQAEQCTAGAALRMRERYVEIFGEEGVPPLEEPDMHVCGG